MHILNYLENYLQLYAFLNKNPLNINYNVRYNFNIKHWSILKHNKLLKLTSHRCVQTIRKYNYNYN